MSCSEAGKLSVDVTYTPNAGYVGDDSFTFTISDGTVHSNVATVNITVNKETGGSANDMYVGSTSSSRALGDRAEACTTSASR